MLRDPKVIEHLNRQLTNELTAVNQYCLHARALQHWGLVTAIIAANITDIKPGSYIGTAAVPQADGVRAFEIQLCPDSMRGVGEGPSLGPPQRTMTNGAVGDIVVTQGRTLTLRYEGWGENRCGAGECPDHHVWSGIPRDAGVGRTSSLRQHRSRTAL